MTIEIIEESDSYIAINKPAGIQVHKANPTDEKENIADMVAKMYPEIADVGEDMTMTNGGEVKRPGIVHRLDRDTSGVMVIARTQDFFLFLKRNFMARKVVKEYHAFVEGVLKNKRGTIDTQYGRSKNDFRKFNTSRTSGKIRQATTEYVVKSEYENTTFLTMFPQTGRTHQLRVHARSIGHPILADSLYNTHKDEVLGFKRMALHAYKIRIPLPDGETISFVAPYPEDFMSAIALYEQK